MKDKVKKWLFEEESGQGLVEYALIITLMAIAAVGAVLWMKMGVITTLNHVVLNLQGSIV